MPSGSAVSPFLSLSVGKIWVGTKYHFTAGIFSYWHYHDLEIPPFPFSSLAPTTLPGTVDFGSSRGDVFECQRTVLWPLLLLLAMMLVPRLEVIASYVVRSHVHRTIS